MKTPSFILIKSRKAFETEVSRQAMEACEQIIAEIGADLHDDLIQKLSIFRLYMDRIERAAKYPNEVEALIIKMRADFQEVIESVRKISGQLLQARMDDDTFGQGIELLCQNMTRVTAEHIHCESVGQERTISPIAAAYLYRVIQELIHNAFKHSSAWHIWVRLQWQPGNLTIEVEDDGTGFYKSEEVVSRLKKKHNTLKMRTLAIGASIQYEQGTKGLLARVVYPN